MAVIDHCEDPALTDGGVAHEGAAAALLGLRGMPAAAEEIAAGRNVALSALTGGPVHLPRQHPGYVAGGAVGEGARGPGHLRGHARIT